MDNLSLQRKVFDQILEQFPRRADAVDAIAGLLSLGRNAIYRRLRGDSLLTLSELHTLARHFNLSLDRIFSNHNPDQILFTYSFFTRQVSSIGAYLNLLSENARQLSELSEVEVFSTFQELPIFLYFSSPSLFAFKMYVYAITYWNLEAMQREKFSMKLISRDDLARAHEVAGLYQSLPSTELWGASLVDNTLNQIRYFATVDAFADPKEALRLCDAVGGVINHARHMAQSGRKFAPTDGKPGPGNRFDLYSNEFYRTNDNILVRHRGGQVLFTSFGTPNFLKTNDAGLCNQVGEWFHAILSRSVSLSIHASAERERYFLDLERRVARMKEHIQLLIKH